MRTEADALFDTVPSASEADDYMQVEEEESTPRPVNKRDANMSEDSEDEAFVTPVTRRTLMKSTQQAKPMELTENSEEDNKKLKVGKKKKTVEKKRAGKV
jgi:hypothetical protein